MFINWATVKNHYHKGVLFGLSEGTRKITNKYVPTDSKSYIKRVAKT